MRGIYLLFVGVFLSYSALNAQTPKVIFEDIWKTLDENYVFFEYKKADWNAIGATYRPQISDTMSEYALFKICSEMLAELHDFHVVLSTKKGTTLWKYTSNDLPNGLNINAISDYYFTKKGELLPCGAFYYQWLGKETAYVYYPSFANKITNPDLDSLFKKINTAKALVLDLRDNEGGNAQNMFQLTNRFASKRTQIGYVFSKKGKKHHQLDKGKKVWLEPHAPTWTKPVYILLSDWSYSATTIFSGFLSQLPNVTLVGTKTGGGAGLPSAIKFENGWSCRFPTAFFVLNNKQYIENGVLPNIIVPHHTEENGKDAVLERVIELCKEVKE
jgi:Peptidase family S41/Tricorn protease C1 domain